MVECISILILNPDAANEGLPDLHLVQDIAMVT